ncbi:MAG: carbohydrate ABC transporter permease [Hydrogeniiclostridium sp.]
MIGVRTAKIRSSRIDRIYNAVNTFLLGVLLIIVAYPLYFIVIASFSDPSAVGTGQVLFFPKGLNLEGYQRIFEYEMLWVGYRNSIFYAVAGTLLSVSLTMMAAYVFTRNTLPGRKFFLILYTIPMFFNGGLIPTYLVVQDLHLVNSPFILILLGAVSMYNIIITKTYIRSNIPEELFEAAKIDGCGNIRYFFSIILPLSKAIIAVLVVFTVVGQWNSYFNALIYISDKALYPLQLVIRDILNTQTAMMQALETGGMGADALAEIYQAESMKYGVIIVSSLPMMIVYPFAQKYFTKGVMIGAVKG